jgi:hypothetical protein
MADTSRSPGPIAEQAFENGFKAAILGGLLGIGSLYWTDVLSTANGLHTTLTVVLFPVYLVFAATALGVWLGFATDGSDLHHVTREVDGESEDSG